MSQEVPWLIGWSIELSENAHLEHQKYFYAPVLGKIFTLICLQCAFKNIAHKCLNLIDVTVASSESPTHFILMAFRDDG